VTCVSDNCQSLLPCWVTAAPLEAHVACGWARRSQQVREDLECYFSHVPTERSYVSATNQVSGNGTGNPGSVESGAMPQRATSQLVLGNYMHQHTLQPFRLQYTMLLPRAKRRHGTNEDRACEQAYPAATQVIRQLTSVEFCLPSNTARVLTDGMWKRFGLLSLCTAAHRVHVSRSRRPQRENFKRQHALHD
jgi:hypothetical protein